jgi:hypothetical protein
LLKSKNAAGDVAVVASPAGVKNMKTKKKARDFQSPGLDSLRSGGSAGVQLLSRPK